MEDILASIKRIIAEDGAAASSAPPPPKVRRGPVEVPRADPPAREEVLELTEAVAPVVTPEPEPEAVVETPPPAAVEPIATAEADAGSSPRAEPPAAPAATILSEQAASASRHSLEALSAMIVAPAPGQDDTLNGLVRELLRPLLKDWLDAKLPELVEGLVAREIARITGRL